MSTIDELRALAEDWEEGKKKKSQADVLLEIASGANLFRTPDGDAYADLEVNGHRETWQVSSHAFRLWLSRAYYQATQKAPNPAAVNAATEIIEARARFDAAEAKVHVRVAQYDGAIYIDLCDTAWRAIEVDATGWRIVDRPPVRFRRGGGMLPLPLPEPGGSIDNLRGFLNVDEDDFILAVAWLLCALRGRGPYLILVVNGEPGSAKSTFSITLRKIVDPHTAAARGLPKEPRDLHVATKNQHALVFTNISHLPEWVSNTLCMIATGESFATRALYTDDEETLFTGACPIILNGIEDMVERADLADRSISFLLEPIPDESRRTEIELDVAFRAVWPGVFGALLDALSHGLRTLPGMAMPPMPRMADCAQWVMACEGALWKPGTFMQVYTGNRVEAQEVVLAGDLVGTAICRLMESKFDPDSPEETEVADNLHSKGTPMPRRESWTGTLTELLDALKGRVTEEVARSPKWPKSPRGLSGKIRLVARLLRGVGIVPEIDKGHARTISITWAKNAPVGSPPTGANGGPTGANGGWEVTHDGLF